MALSRKERWAKEYVPLTPEDFELPVTPEKRVRVAAAVATLVRDRAMFGGAGPGPNAESIRAVLVATEEEWALTIAEKFPELGKYDPVSPFERFQDVSETKR